MPIRSRVAPARSGVFLAISAAMPVATVLPLRGAADPSMIFTRWPEFGTRNATLRASIPCARYCRRAGSFRPAIATSCPVALCKALSEKRDRPARSPAGVCRAHHRTRGTSYVMSSDAVADFGARLRAIRLSNNWTITDVARMTGLAISTVSKVENGRMSLTYDKLMQLARGLSLDLAELLAPTSSPVSTASNLVTARRSVNRAKDFYHITAGSYDYWYLNTDLARKAFAPIIGETTARSLEEFGKLIRHDGEEFLFVMEGSVIVHTEFYSPVRLEVGECIYIDSTMGHAYLAVDCERARFLCVCTQEDPLQHSSAQHPPAKAGDGSPIQNGTSDLPTGPNPPRFSERSGKGARPATPSVPARHGAERRRLPD